MNYENNNSNSSNVIFHRQPPPRPEPPKLSRFDESSALPMPTAPLPAGPLGVRYDDSLSVLKIYLVVIGIREKSMFRAANTDVHLKYDENGFSILLEVFNMNKKSKPPKKTVLDTRYFEKSKLPGKVAKCEYKLKKDQCVLQIHKAVPGLWANALSL